MPYSVNVIRIQGRDAELDVTPEQPDADPFPLDHGFAVGLLVGAAHRLRWDEASGKNVREATGPLGRELGTEAIDVLATGGGDPDRFVSDVSVLKAAPWPWRYGEPPPTATYRVTTTDARWLEHLQPNQKFVSYAYSETGPFYA
jgi:hypothetical protein